MKISIANIAKNFFIPALSIVLGLVGCAQTPNNITITASQSQCVTATNPGYESNLFPINTSLPANSPYCVAITVTNNNSGTNANNVQLTSAGIQVGYTINGVVSSATLYDPTAATVTISGQSQTIGNLAIMDPNNCATTQGIQVQTLMQNGDQCTFYLQLLSESLPVGIYPTTVVYNYTNGNANYLVTANLNQRVNLYAGGFGVQNNYLTIFNAVSGNNTLISASYPGNGGVNTIINDQYGNVLVGDNLGNVYWYNGMSQSSWTLLVSSAQTANASVSALTTDNSGNLYIATSNNIYQIGYLNGQALSVLGAAGLNIQNNQIPTSLVFQSSSTGNISTLYTSVNNQIYSCTLGAGACNWSTGGINPAPSAINQFGYINGVPTIATESNGIEVYNNANWNSIITSGNDLPVGRSVNTMTIYNNSFYVGLNANQNLNESYAAYSSVYMQSSSGLGFIPLFSTTANNLGILTGNVYALAIDYAGNVFVGGNGLISSDIGTSAIPLAYLATTNGTATGIWTAENGLANTATINALEISTQLTTY